jgi:uncharacterized protein (TIGR00255 family)
MYSMTGQGDAHCEDADYAISVEIRAVNNRHLKVALRGADRVPKIEASIESLVRGYVKRGSLQIIFKIEEIGIEVGTPINSDVLDRYIAEAKSAAQRSGLAVETISVASLMTLPGVVASSSQSSSTDEKSSQLHALATAALESALTALNEMRVREGQAMANQLLASIDQLRQFATSIEARAPVVIENYRERLRSRVSAALSELKVDAAPADLLREVQIFADRCDIREEIVRLDSHFQQFEVLCRDANSQGRKLDFLTQELLRETNTIGSKANDAGIAQHVVEMKTTIEQLREIVQNVQ